jgi:hypothetical protein
LEIVILHLLERITLFKPFSVVIHASIFVLQIIDVAVSLAKVADVNRGLGNEKAATERFQEAVKCLECLSLQPNEEASLEKRVSHFYYVIPLFLLLYNFVWGSDKFNMRRKAPSHAT